MNDPDISQEIGLHFVSLIHCPLTARHFSERPLNWLSGKVRIKQKNKQMNINLQHQVDGSKKLKMNARVHRHLGKSDLLTFFSGKTEYFSRPGQEIRYDFSRLFSEERYRSRILRPLFCVPYTVSDISNLVMMD